MKRTKRLMALTAAAFLGFGMLSGCAGRPGGNADLKITISKLGYGTEWLKAIAEKYTEKTGVTFDIVEPVGNAGIDAIYAEMESLASDTDIFITRQRHFFETIYKGSISVDGVRYPCQYADLTDVYKADSDGSTIKEKMKPEFEQFYNVDEAYYGLPWAESALGIVRNKDVWDKLGFTDADVPLTTDELFDLCDTIKSKTAASADLKGVAPFIYSLSDEYYTSFVPLWFGQYEGSESIRNFFNGLDPAGETSYNLYAYDGQEKALEVLNELITDKNGYQHGASKDLTFTNMQSYFLMGQAVFCVNGTWLEIEMGSNYKGANIDYIKTPVISALSEKLSYYQSGADTANNEKLSALVGYVDAHPEEGDNADRPAGTTEEDVEIVRDARHIGSYLGEGKDHIVSIPAYSRNIEAAKEFLKFIYSDEGLNIFYEVTQGQMLPVIPTTGYDESKISATTFRKAINDVLNEGYILPWESSMPTKIYALGGVSTYWNNGLTTTVMKALLQGTSPASIINTNQSYLKTNWKTITDY